MRKSARTSSSETPHSSRIEALPQPARSLPVVQWKSAGRLAASSNRRHIAAYAARALGSDTSSR